MNIPADYLEDQVRDGFPVPEYIKRAWAVQLKILEWVHNICMEYGITYYAESGTLLGVVRHGGYIPWDDDLDIVMKRPDYERFLEIAKDKLPEGYCFLNIYTEETYDNYLTRIVNNKLINRTENFLNDNYGCPYIMGIDLFVMDYLAPTKELMEEQGVEIGKLSTYTKKLDAGEKEIEADAVAYMKSICDKYSFDIRQYKSRSLANRLRIVQDQLLSLYQNRGDDEEITKLGLSPLWVDHKGSIYEKYFFGVPVWMGFETMTIPVPAYYDEILSRKYGEYMKLLRQGGLHGYPFFDEQKQILEKQWGPSSSEYVFTDDVKKALQDSIDRQNNSTTLQKRDGRILDYQEYIDMLGQAYEGFISAFESGQYELALTILQKCQEVAISLGNKIEDRLGSSIKTIGVIEEYCESVFQLYTAITENDDERIGKWFGDMANNTNRIEESINSDIVDKRIVVILPYRSCFWDSLHSIWLEEAGREDTIVYVMPVPYYERDMVGKVMDVEAICCDMAGYPEEVKLTDFRQLDIEKLRPDVIIFQNPYDSFNSVTTVNPKYYSDRLKNCTDRLVYIPYIKVDEFEKSDHRAYRNMHDIIIKPGVINADQIILGSDKIKDIYIQLLTEYAGNEFRDFWESKITVQTSENHRSAGDKKTLIYYVSASKLLKNGINGIDKIRRNLEIFKASRDNIFIKWYQTRMDEDILMKYIPDIYEEYKKLVEEYKALGIGSFIILEDVNKYDRDASGFYGDPGRLLTAMIVDKKPVMVANFDV